MELMANNRELLAREIVDRFVASISGTKVDTIIGYNPNDRIYVGKLSPQSESCLLYTSDAADE